MAKYGSVRAEIIKASTPAEKVSAQTGAAAWATGDLFIAPPTDLRGYKQLVNNSAILPQCIRAYKNNIAGFGIGVRYKDDVPETPAMRAEWDRITEVLEHLNLDQDTKEVFQALIEARETYGIAYLEVIRNLAGEVTGVELIRQTPSIQRTAQLDPYVEVTSAVRGRVEKRQRRFCKYRQDHLGSTVFFKEIGDPRPMDRRTGAYGDAVAIEHRANELLAFPIGAEPYGEVRWIGQVLGVDGSRRAETLNNRYFSEGRHTPLMIMVKGGTLTEESFAKLQGYMNDIKGESGQHAFIVLEADNLDSRTDMEGEKAPEIEIHNLASMLQKDELFQDYLDNNRRKAQSAFQLPDLYVGYTTDFNRATAHTAQEVTEKQVFQPERQSFAWVINHKLLADYHFEYVEAYFRAPELSNPEDITKILNITERAGGLTPNKAKEITYKVFGETCENYEGDWGNLPIISARRSRLGDAMGDLLDPQGGAVQKSMRSDNIEIACVLKEIRAYLASEAKP